MSEKSRHIYEEAAAAAAAADMTLLLGSYRHTHPAHVLSASVSRCHDDQQVLDESVESSLLDPLTRSPDSCFADYYSQTDADLSD